MHSSTSNKTFSVVLPTAAAALIAFAGYKFMYAAEKVLEPADCSKHNRLIISKDKMIDILDDLKIHLTPYYVHYFNVI